MDYRNFTPEERERSWRERRLAERDEDRDRGRQQWYGGGDRDDFERRGWRKGGDYYGDNPERYGERRYGRSWRDDRNADVWGGETRESSDERYRGSGFADAFGDFTAPDDSSMLRWSDADERSRYASDWRRDRADWPEDRYDERTARDAQRWRSDMLRYGGWGSLASAAGLRRGEIRGEFSGRGPRGYRRADERIREDVCDLLTEDGIIDASEIEVLVQNGEVTLSGAVDSRTEKRRAEDLIQDLAGVKDVHNRLRTSQPGLLERAADALRPQESETTRTGPGARR